MIVPQTHKNGKGWRNLKNLLDRHNQGDGLGQYQSVGGRQAYNLKWYSHGRIGFF